MVFEGEIGIDKEIVKRPIWYEGDYLEIQLTVLEGNIKKVLKINQEVASCVWNFLDRHRYDILNFDGIILKVTKYKDTVDIEIVKE